MANNNCKTYPKVIRELARTRVEYERGRFLLPDVIGLPRKTKDAVDQWIVKCEHPLGFKAGTQENRIVSLVKECYRKKRY